MDKKKLSKRHLKKVILPEKQRCDYYLLFLLVLIILVSIIRYRLTSVLFERDEGEYSYIGSMFLHGVAPYKDAYSMKLPGTSFMYAVLMLIFGHTNTGVHLGMIFINAGTMYFLFAAFKKIFNPFIGLATASIYGLMAIGLAFDGFAAHATQFICFYSSLSLLFLAIFMKSGKPLKIFLYGLMLGIAFLMKQQALFLILFGVIFLFIYLKTGKKQGLPEIIKKLLLFSSGVCIPYIIVVLIVLFTGQFNVFWLWTMEYAAKYEGTMKNMKLIVLFFKYSFLPAWDEFYYLWVLAVAGILVLYWSPYSRLQKLFVLIYFIASICAVSSGFYFRPHYYIIILPAIGLLTGIFVEFIIKQFGEWINILKSPYTALIILSLIVLFTTYTNRKYYFSDSSFMVCSLAYRGDPFNIAPYISKYISDNTTDTDKIAIFGSEPEICFYANRTSATGYLYTYPLVENQSFNEFMQEEMIKEIEKNKPALFVYCNIPSSWLVQPGSPRTIFEWGNKYIRDCYTSVGFVDFFNNKGWHINLNEDVKYDSTHPDGSLLIFKRKPDNKL